MGKTNRDVFRSFFDGLRTNYDAFGRFLYAFDPLFTPYG